MSNPDNNNPLQNYARYTSIGIQMAVIIFLGVFGGFKLDQYLGTTPLLIILLSFAGVTLAIYHAIKDFLKQNKRKEDK
jgi:F0F1-type ATP synthase assembly protein I